MMSEANDDIDLRMQLSNLDRDRAETQKLFAETQKLVSEMQKLNAEQIKLGSEGRNFDRDRSVQTLLAVTGLIGGIITVFKLVWPGRLP